MKAAAGGGCWKVSSGALGERIQEGPGSGLGLGGSSAEMLPSRQRGAAGKKDIPLATDH